MFLSVKKISEKFFLWDTKTPQSVKSAPKQKQT